MKRVLMVAFHFPPFSGSSGVQRTLRFVQHLPDFGWQPIVLTAHPRAYEATSMDLVAEVPATTVVNRAFALNSARHLSLFGRYLAASARPDRWVSWKFDAIRQGMALIRQYQPDALWSTYPIPTAHLVGAELAKRSQLPWVADFRDPMAQNGYPADPKTWRKFASIEADTVGRATLATFTTPGAVACYRERYPSKAQAITLLENGYDEDSFRRAECLLGGPEPLVAGAVTLLHSGVIYPEERDPDALFRALQLLKHRNPSSCLKIRFRASTQDALLHELARRYDVVDKIETLPAIPYEEALAEMMRADGLLVLQAANCNAQIPAKLYEYFRGGRPVVALTDPHGDTAGAVRACGFDWLSPLSDPERISRLFSEIEVKIHSGEVPVAAPDVVCRASRLRRTQQLAAFLDGVSGSGNDQSS